jgi:hypothetical protein
VKQKDFVFNLCLLIFLNLLVKPFWMLGVDVGVQNSVGAADYGLYFSIFNFTMLFSMVLDMGTTNFNNRTIARNNQLLEKHLSSIVILRLLLAVIYMAVIFTVGDPACIGALAAIKAAGANTKMIGFDANPEAHEAILDPEDGKIWVGDVAQDPFQIGHKIAEEMVKYMTEGTVDDQTILIAPYLVDASNAVKPE